MGNKSRHMVRKGKRLKWVKKDFWIKRKKRRQIAKKSRQKNRAK
jgi:hypothetical protein